MKVNYILEKGSGQLNEDKLVMTKDTFGVFDGATDLYKYKDKEGRTSGFLAADIARKVFENGNKSLLEHVTEANSEIKKEMTSHGIDTNDKSRLWSTTAAVVKLNKDYFNWIQVGDSLILNIYKDNSYKLLVNNYDHDVEVLSQWKELADKKIDDIRKKVDEPLKELRMTMNTKYGVLNGDEKMKNFLNSGRISLKTVNHVIIFTDGLIIPKENPRKKDDFEKFTQLFLEGGLERIRDYIRSLEKDDPKCWKYPRYKQYDDIAAISISFV